MLKSERMLRVLITGPKTFIATTIEVLHKRKIVHIIEHIRDEELDIGRPLEDSARISEILVQIRAIISTLGIKQKKINLEKVYELYIKPEKGLDYEQLNHVCSQVSERFSNDNEQIKRINEQISKISSMIKSLEIFDRLKVEAESFTKYESIAYFVGLVNNVDVEKEIRKITRNYELVYVKEKNKLLIALFADTRVKDKIQALLSKYNFAHIEVPDDISGSNQENLKRLRKELELLEVNKKAVQDNINDIKERYADFLLHFENVLKQEVDKTDVPLRFAETENFFMITGWVPEDKVMELNAELKKKTDDKIHFMIEKPGKHEDAPIKLRNPGVTKPFEFLIKLYTLPKYEEIDPTFFLFLTFPIFFGFMLGDIGYGAISLLIFLLIRWKMPETKEISNILMLSSLATIIFGFVFGEFFGYELFQPIISREHDMINVAGNEIHRILIYSIIFGLLHINLSLLIGFYNELNAHGIKAAILEKFSWILLEFAIAIMITAYISFEFISIPFGIGLIMSILSVIMIWKGEGVKGLIELPILLTNTLSYARLAALGLASVLLAVVVNEFSFEFFHSGNIFMIIAGMLILVTGHLINLGLGILGPFLQSLRLHYVEFFLRFYKGGGKKFRAFGEYED